MASRLEKTLGRRVAAYRHSAGLTQEELAERVRVAPETISRVERGATIPSLRTLDAIASALGVVVHDLLHFDAEKPRSTKDQSIDAFARELKMRSDADIKLIQELARRVFKHVDSAGQTRRER